jgi:hypothetical protein
VNQRQTGHTRVYVWCECGVCGLCASKLYPIKKPKPHIQVENTLRSVPLDAAFFSFGLHLGHVLPRHPSNVSMVMVSRWTNLTVYFNFTVYIFLNCSYEHR